MVAGVQVATLINAPPAPAGNSPASAGSASAFLDLLAGPELLQSSNDSAFVGPILTQMQFTAARAVPSAPGPVKASSKKAPADQSVPEIAALSVLNLQLLNAQLPAGGGSQAQASAAESKTTPENPSPLTTSSSSGAKKSLSPSAPGLTAPVSTFDPVSNFASPEIPFPQGRETDPNTGSELLPAVTSDAQSRENLSANSISETNAAPQVLTFDQSLVSTAPETVIPDAEPPVVSGKTGIPNPTSAFSELADSDNAELEQSFVSNLMSHVNGDATTTAKMSGVNSVVSSANADIAAMPASAQQLTNLSVKMVPGASIPASTSAANRINPAETAPKSPKSVIKSTDGKSGTSKTANASDEPHLADLQLPQIQPAKFSGVAPQEGTIRARSADKSSETENPNSDVSTANSKPQQAKPAPAHKAVDSGSSQPSVQDLRQQAPQQVLQAPPDASRNNSPDARPVVMSPLTGPQSAAPRMDDLSPKPDLKPADANAMTAPLQVQAARIIQSGSQLEMRVGLRTDAFGAVQVHATVSNKQVDLALGSERGDLRASLTSDLPNLQSSLQQHDLQLQQVRTLPQASAAQSGLFSGGGGQQQGFHHSAPRTDIANEARDAEGDETDRESPATGLNVRV